MKLYLKNNIDVEYIEADVEDAIQLLTSYVDVASIPNCFGDTIEDRIATYMKFREKGICFIDSTQVFK